MKTCPSHIRFSDLVNRAFASDTPSINLPFKPKQAIQLGNTIALPLVSRYISVNNTHTSCTPFPPSQPGYRVPFSHTFNYSSSVPHVCSKLVHFCAVFRGLAGVLGLDNRELMALRVGGVKGLFYFAEGRGVYWGD
jgi:hypothetical protein